MSLSVLHYLCLVTLLSHNLASCTITEDEEPRRTFPFRRAIDGTRGRKFYEPEDDGFLNSYESSGRYDPDHQANDFSDIRNNIPGEPGIDYPAYARLPQTGFVCEPKFRGYYADEEAGCQVFHICDGNFLVSSFLCPMGSIFSQKLLTCDWWAKVNCSASRNYHAINSETLVSEADDDEILRKVFEISSVQSAGERIPASTVNQQQEPESQERKYRVQNYGSTAVTERSNDLQTGPDKNSDYPEYPSRKQSRFQSRAGQKSRQRYQEDDYYNEDVEEEANKPRSNLPIRVQPNGEDRRNDRTFGNEFQPSYAPTVPTVSTTTRRFYSPTFPTTYRPSIDRESRGRFDLEFESSDHLYSARGRSDETVKAAKAPSVTSKITTHSKHISLPVLVNNADETTYRDGNKQESKSSYYRSNVTIPPLRINTTKVSSSVKAINSKDLTNDAGKITETFSILTIDNDNRDPNTFAYNQEETPISRNRTNVKLGFTFAEKNSTRTAKLETDKKVSKLAAFLQPPQEVKNQFQIKVVEEPNIPKNHHKVSKSKKLDETNLNVHDKVIPSIEVPAVRITPPLVDGKSGTRDSRVIRIFVDNHNSSSDAFGSLEPLTKKLDSDDSTSLVEDNDGQHSETKIIAEKLSKEQEDVVDKISENKNSTGNAEMVSSKKDSSNNATSISSELDKTYLIDLINAAVALERSGFKNSASQAPVELSSTDAKVNKNDDSKLEKSLSNYKTSEEKNDEDKEKQNGSNKTLNAETKISQTETNKQLSGGEKLLLDAKLIVTEENKSADFEKSKEDLLNSKSTVPDEENGGGDQNPIHDGETVKEKTRVPQEKHDEYLDDKKATLLEEKKSVGDGKKSVGDTISEEILFTAATTIPEEKNSEGDKKTSDKEETVSAKTIVSQEKSIELSSGSQEVSIDVQASVAQDKKNTEDKKSEQTVLDTKTIVSEGKNSTKDQKENSDDNTSGAKTTVSQVKSIELSIVSEPIMFDPKTIDREEKITENREHSVGNEKTLVETKTLVSNANVSKDHEHSIDTKEILLSTRPTDSETKNTDNHERPSRSDQIGSIGANIEDSVVEGSSPLQVTLTVNKNEDLDPTGNVIRKLIAKQEIDDSDAAADYKNFEIIKSDQPEASKDGPHDTFTAADSRSDRRIEVEGGISEERLPNFRSNGLRSRDYYRSIVDLVNGPNQPRPFSLESPHNLEVRTLSDIGGAVPSIAGPFISGNFRNDLIRATTRIPAQEILQSSASPVQASQQLKKLSSSTKTELSNKDEDREQLGQTFGERRSEANNERLIFELPEEHRSLDFKTGNPLETTQQTNSRLDDENKELRTTQKNNEDKFPKTVIETEFIPSISFALNTDEEREEYMEAVMKGLLSDVRATESTNNDTNTSLES